MDRPLAKDWKGFKALPALNPELVLVALLVDLTPDAYAEALPSGAVAAVAWEAAPESIVKVLTAALAGDTLIPRRGRSGSGGEASRG